MIHTKMSAVDMFMTELNGDNTGPVIEEVDGDVLTQTLEARVYSLINKVREVLSELEEIQYILGT